MMTVRAAVAAAAAALASGDLYQHQQEEEGGNQQHIESHEHLKTILPNHYTAIYFSLAAILPAISFLSSR
jgi:hypothetical protein